jgi:excisionase family DNA binding protein
MGPGRRPPQRPDSARGRLARRQTVQGTPEAVSDEPLLTARDVAERLGVDVGWIYDEWQAGRLPGFRLGSRMLRFRWSEIEAWLESHRSGPDVDRGRLQAVG